MRCALFALLALLFFSPMIYAESGAPQIKFTCPPIDASNFDQLAASQAFPSFSIAADVLTEKFLPDEFYLGRGTPNSFDAASCLAPMEATLKSALGNEYRVSYMLRTQRGKNALFGYTFENEQQILQFIDAVEATGIIEEYANSDKKPTFYVGITPVVSRIENFVGYRTVRLQTNIVLTIGNLDNAGDETIQATLIGPKGKQSIYTYVTYERRKWRKPIKRIDVRDFDFFQREVELTSGSGVIALPAPSISDVDKTTPAADVTPTADVISPSAETFPDDTPKAAPTPLPNVAPVVTPIPVPASPVDSILDYFKKLFAFGK